MSMTQTIGKAVRLDLEHATAWDRIKRARGNASDAEAFRELIRNIDDGIRKKLDVEALQEYEAGTLTREKFGRACLRRKQAQAGE